MLFFSHSFSVGKTLLLIIILLIQNRTALRQQQRHRFEMRAAPLPEGVAVGTPHLRSFPSCGAHGRHVRSPARPDESVPPPPSYGAAVRPGVGAGFPPLITSRSRALSRRTPPRREGKKVDMDGDGNAGTEHQVESLGTPFLPGRRPGSAATIPTPCGRSRGYAGHPDYVDTTSRAPRRVGRPRDRRCRQQVPQTSAANLRTRAACTASRCTFTAAPQETGWMKTKKGAPEALPWLNRSSRLIELVELAGLVVHDAAFRQAACRSSAEDQKLNRMPMSTRTSFRNAPPRLCSTEACQVCFFSVVPSMPRP